MSLKQTEFKNIMNKFFQYREKIDALENQEAAKVLASGIYKARIF
jgi:hypothetical protein